MTALPAGIALFIAYRRRRWLSALIALGIVGSAVAVITSESRTNILTAIATLIAAMALIAVGRDTKRAITAALLAAGVVVIAVAVIGSSNSGAFYRYSSITPSKLGSTIYSSRSGTWSTIPKYIVQIPFGAGLGKVGSAAGKAGGKLSEATWNGETEFDFLIVEAGIPALLVFLAFNAVLCSTTLRGLRRERDRHTVLLIAALAAPLFGYAATWFVGITTTTPPTAPYLWLAAGIISWWLVTRQKLDHAKQLDPSGATA